MKISEFTNDVMIHKASVSIPISMHDLIRKKMNVHVSKMSEDGQSLDHYDKERNANKSSCDVQTGKYGEILACYWLLQQGFPKVYPDFKVYPKGQKGWDSDLPFADTDSEFPNCHIKTCTEYTTRIVGKMGGYYSWIFQYGNKTGDHGRDKLFDGTHDDEVIILAYVDINNDPFSGIIVASSPWRHLYPILKNPIREDKNQIKKCIYFSALEKIVSEKLAI